MIKPRQERVVRTHNHGVYRLRCMAPGKWEHWTGNVSVVFVQHKSAYRGHVQWIPMLDGQMLSEHAGTKLDTVVKRTMLRAHAASALARGLAAFKEG